MNLQSPTSFAHMIWANIIAPGSLVIDATSGNGHDTLFLAQIALKEDQGSLFAFDIQKKALENTHSLIKEKLEEKILQRIHLVHCCHSQIETHCPGKIDLIAFNLGYLPGSDKSITTESETTLSSLKSSLRLLKEGGYLSIICYPGHAEGEVETATVLNWSKNLDRSYVVTKHHWINRSEKSPFLLLIKNK